MTDLEEDDTLTLAADDVERMYEIIIHASKVTTLLLLDEHDVEALRRVAVLLADNPMVVTPLQFAGNYEHEFLPTPPAQCDAHDDIEVVMLRTDTNAKRAKQCVFCNRGVDEYPHV